MLTNITGLATVAATTAAVGATTAFFYADNTIIMR